MQVSSIITEFNLDESINKIDHHPYITIIGQRFSGKSVLINELVYHLDKKFKYKHIFCFSHTAKLNCCFPWMKQDNIYSSLENLEKIVNIRKQSGNKDNVMLIFDDIAGMTSVGKNGKKKNIRYNDSLEFLSTTARHFNITVILSIQNRVLCSKTCRNNSSFSFIFTPKSHDDTTCIKNEYLGLCRSKAESDHLFDTVFGVPYKCLAVEGYKSGVTNIQDYVSTYIAPFPIRKFKCKCMRKKRLTKTQRCVAESDELKSRINNINNVQKFKLRKDYQLEELAEGGEVE